MSEGFLEQFAEWATNDRLICPSKAIEEAVLDEIDGDEYERTLTTVTREDDSKVEAYIYALRIV